VADLQSGEVGFASVVESARHFEGEVPREVFVVGVDVSSLSGQRHGKLMRFVVGGANDVDAVAMHKTL